MSNLVSAMGWRVVWLPDLDDVVVVDDLMLAEFADG